MACSSVFLTNIETSCGSNVASIKKVYLGNFESLTVTEEYQEDGSGQPIVDDDGKKIIESISSITRKQGEREWVTADFKKNTSSMDSEMTKNDNGSFYYTNTINMVFAKQNVAKRLAVQALVSGECSAIVEDNNQNFWLVGYQNSVSATTTSATTGTAVGDSNQYTVAIAAVEGYLPIPIVIAGSGSTSTYEATKTAIEALLVPENDQ